MQELIKVSENEKGVKVVSARELHKGLKADATRFSVWFERYVTKYGFIENIDFVGCDIYNTLARQELQDYALTLDVAKHICMLQRNEEGMKFRNYFIDCEKQLKEIVTPSYMIENPIDRAERWIQEEKQRQSLLLENKQKDQLINEYEPKASYYDMVLNTPDIMNASIIAKDYGMSAIAFNKKLNELGVQFKQGDTWLLYQKYADKGYTKSKVNTYTDSDGEVHSKFTTKWTQKGRLFIYDLFKSNGILPIIEKQDNDVHKN